MHLLPVSKLYWIFFLLKRTFFSQERVREGDPVDRIREYLLWG